MKKCNSNLLPLIFTSLLFTSTAYSMESTDFVIELAVQSGGEELVTLFNSTNGNDSISAGSGLSLLIGANFNLSNTSYIKLLAGINNDTLSGTGNSISFEFEWQHNPVDLLYMKRIDNFNFGGGITYHINPKLTSNLFPPGEYVGFENALGLKIAADYRFDNNIFLGLEYSVIDYKVNTANTARNTFSGNSVGLVLGYVFAD